ncbi:non-ribosomal peptide synthetase, partial [Mucilaginibacter oryzae]|uniref:non-ribosomal peptide synthetase n=1 Tax=Mucilaginibacter oryzae TaxID=468058 RepID=UPI0011B1FDC4
GIRQACVLARDRETDTGSQRYLVGYYISDKQDDGLDIPFVIASLKDILPEYAIPALFMVLDAFPLTVNGKVDRKKLPEPRNLVSEEYIAPSGDIEGLLLDIWRDALGIRHIGVTVDFFQAGGDSITAILISVRIREAGFDCRVMDIFSARTIRNLSSLLSRGNHGQAIKKDEGFLTGEFGLLPIQDWFMQQVEKGKFPRPGYWNQNFLIQVPPLDSGRIPTIIEELTRHHDILRATFIRKTEWMQRYGDAVKVPPVSILDISGYEENEYIQVLNHWQSGFDFVEGPLFHVGYIYGFGDGTARIFMAFHHLIIDTVSWHVLANDFKTLYENKKLPSKQSSYRQWVAAINSYAQGQPQEAAYWQSQLPDLKSHRLSANIWPATTSSIEMNEALTEELIFQINGAYHTEINDILITAFAYALRDIGGEQEQFITIEGHGREAIDPEIDHSNIVGWFTTLYPFKAELQNDIAASICKIKNDIRKIPNKGVGFGALALHGNVAFDVSDLPVIYFNYLGQVESLRQNWSVIAGESGIGIDAGNQGSESIAVNGMVKLGKLSFQISTRLGRPLTDALSDAFKKNLVIIIAHCGEKLAKEGPGFTSVDFQSVSLGQSLINKIQSQAIARENSIAHIYPANSLQQGFIYHTLSYAGDDAYRLQLVHDYHQAMIPSAYISAWKLCIAQYPILRTGFNWDEEPIQVIYQTAELNYKIHDVSHLIEQRQRDEMIAEIQKIDRNIGFDLTQPGLFRVHIIKQSANSYTTILTQHHIIADGWSGPILLNTLHRYYQALIYDEKIDVNEDTAYLKAQYYISFQKKIVADYWNKKLGEHLKANDINAMLSSPIDMATYRVVKDPQNKVLEVSGDLLQHITDLSKTLGITVNVIITFAWHKLLQIYSNSDLTIVGTTVSGRELPIAGIAESVGLFINTLPLIVNWDNGCNIEDQLLAIQNSLIELNENSFADLVSMQEEGQRLFQTLYVFENYPVPWIKTEEQPEINMRSYADGIDYPFSIMVLQFEDVLVIKLKHDGEHVTAEKLGQLIFALKSTLQQIVDDPKMSHRNISLLSQDSYNLQVREWNLTDRFYRLDQTMHSVFVERARLVPDNIAVVYEGLSLSYRELDERSNQLARHIREHYAAINGVSLKPGSLICLLLDRGLELVIGILAVLKSGGAYVPLDPSYPIERISYILSDTNASVVLSTRELIDKEVSRLVGPGLICIGLSESFYNNEEVSELKQYSKSDDLAYVIYTSGTTGRPKGAQVQHRSLINLNTWYIEEFALKADDRCIVCTEICFDLTQKNYFAPLFSGCTIFLPSSGHYDPRAIAENIVQNGIRRINCTPSAFLPIQDEVVYLLKNHRFDYIFLGGEPIPDKLARLIAETNPDSWLVNTYGPTECADVTTFFKVHTSLLIPEQILLGKPVWNFRHYVLDVHGQIVPLGVAGELYIGGAGVGLGYLNNPSLTSDRFVANVYGGAEDQSKGYDRLYRTGDIVRWHADGNLEYIGR